MKFLITMRFLGPKRELEFKTDALAGKINEIDPRKILLVFVNEVGHESLKEYS